MKKLIIIFIMISISYSMTIKQEKIFRKIGITLLSITAVSYLTYEDGLYSRDFLTYSGSALVLGSFSILISLPLGGNKCIKQK